MPVHTHKYIVRAVNALEPSELTQAYLLTATNTRVGLRLWLQACETLPRRLPLTLQDAVCSARFARGLHLPTYL